MQDKYFNFGGNVGSPSIVPVGSDGLPWGASASPISAGGITQRVTATLTRASDATQYSIGDAISLTTATLGLNFTSAARVAGGSGRIVGARCAIQGANPIALPAFDILLFRPEANIPFGTNNFPVDNAPLAITFAAYAEMIGFLSFPATGWRNPSGGTTASGSTAYQSASFLTRPYAPFKLPDGAINIPALLQAQNTWNPGAVVYTFSFALDVDLD